MINKILKFTPNHLLSRWVNKLSLVENKFIKNKLINFAIKKYGINLKDYERENIEDYVNFNDFFTREIKRNLRNFEPTDCSKFLSPCDGFITQIQKAEGDTLIQAKGKNYSLKSLLTEKHYSTTINNSDSAIIYLSPRDYHRIHAPFDIFIHSMTYVPGKLFPVNNKAISEVDNLYSKNERLIIETHVGDKKLFIVLVGAIFVGNISTTWEGCVNPNYSTGLTHWNYSGSPIKINRMEEVGMFSMGSTVVLVSEDGLFDRLLNIKEGNIKVGQII